MTGPAYPTEDEIHAYVDGALDAGRCGEITAIMLEDAPLAARVAAYIADRDALRLALTAALIAPLPPAWLARIDAAGIQSATSRGAPLSRRGLLGTGLATAAAGALVAMVGTRSGGILEDALAARSRLPAALSQADADPPGGAAPAVWLRSVLGLAVQPPDLGRFGFRLASLRRTAPRAVQMAYGDAQGRLLTIYVRPSDGAPRFDLLRQGGLRVCVWQDDVVGAVILAPMSAGEMMRVATSAYASLNL